MLTITELAKQLNLSKGYISKCVKAGCPQEVEAARTWLSVNKVSRTRKLPTAKAPSALPKVDDDAPVAALTAGSLTQKIARLRQLVDRAADNYEAALNAGDASQGKLQSAYNALFNRLIALEDEEKRRAIESEIYIRKTRALEIINTWTARVVERLDKLPLDCAEKCNPDRPQTAIKALEQWKIQVRKELAE